MVKARHQRVGSEFHKMICMFQDNLNQLQGRRPSYSEVTNGISQFLLEERIHERMIQRAKHNAKYRRGLF